VKKWLSYTDINNTLKAHSNKAGICL